MESIAKADIFFFITSVSIIIITVILIIAGYYVIRTLKNIHDMSKTMKRAVHSTEVTVEDITERVTTSALFRFIFGRRKQKKEK